MADARIDQLLALRRKNPADSRILFALALEYEKLEQWNEVVTTLREYLGLADDEGNAWGRLGRALQRIGRIEDAHSAWTSGIDAATRHGHPSMAAEFEELIEDLAS